MPQGSALTGIDEWTAFDALLVEVADGVVILRRSRDSEWKTQVESEIASEIDWSGDILKENRPRDKEKKLMRAHC